MSLLSEMKPGQVATVMAVAGEPSLVQRLAEFGLFDGESVEFVAVAPLGDPVEVRIGDTRLSLRLREARCVTVTPPEARP